MRNTLGVAQEGILDGDAGVRGRAGEVRLITGLALAAVAALWSIWPYWLAGPPPLNGAWALFLVFAGGMLVSRSSPRGVLVSVGVLGTITLGASIAFATAGRSTWLAYMANTVDAAHFNAPSPWVTLAASLGTGLTTAVGRAVCMFFGAAAGAFLDRRTPNQRIERTPQG